MICEHELELDNLRRAITRGREFDPELGFTAGQRRMLSLLFKRLYVRPEALGAILSGSGVYNGPSLRATVSMLRRKLPDGVVIEHRQGFYQLIGKEELKKYIIRI